MSDDSTDSQADDLAWIHPHHRDDRDAFAAVVRAYRDGLYNYVTHLLRGAEGADDLIQEVFAALWIKREQLQVTVSLRAYLYAAARNRTLDHLTRAHRARHLEVDDPASDAPASGLASDSAALVETDELTQALQHAIDHLPARCREIFILAREEELSYPEIAATLGVTVGTVKTQMSRAMHALRNAAAPFLLALLVLHPH